MKKTVVIAAGLLSSLMVSSAWSMYKLVTVTNATACHVTNDGRHYLGHDTEVYGFGADKEYVLYPGQAGLFPVILDDERMELFSIVDNGWAADEWEIRPYMPGDQYILSDDNGTGICAMPGYPPYQCFKYSKINPCAS